MSFLNYLSPNGPQRQLVSQLMSSNGDGTGTVDWVGDYSSGAIAKLIPPSGQVYRVARMIVSIQDDGAVNDSSKYGNITITRGIYVKLHDHRGTTVLTPHTITTTFDWGTYCYDVTVTDFATGGNYYQARWSFDKSGQFLRLDGDQGDQFHVHLGDDFTGLNHHTFLVQGYIEDGEG